MLKVEELGSRSSGCGGGMDGPGSLGGGEYIEESSGEYISERDCELNDVGEGVNPGDVKGEVV